MIDEDDIATTTATSAQAEPGTQPERAWPGPEAASRRTRAGALWAGIVVSAAVLLLLLILIVKNGDPVEISFLGWAATLPTGMALLAAAVAGILIVAVPGAARVLQLRRAARAAARTGRPA